MDVAPPTADSTGDAASGGLAYAFWHAPRAHVGAASYEVACAAWLDALDRHRPGGLLMWGTWRTATPPWLPGWPRKAYLDLYVLTGFAALGALNASAVAPPLAAAHRAAAAVSGHGTAGLYAARSGVPQVGVPAVVSFHRRDLPVPRVETTGHDGAREGVRDGRTVWQRQLTLGPGPEFMVVTTLGPAPAAAAWRGSVEPVGPAVPSGPGGRPTTAA